MKVGFPDNIFEKSLLDYHDWKTAWFREALQNAVDAGATEVHFHVDEVKKRLACSDNGCGMNKDVLINKLLHLGESYKEEGSIGGFGRAKEILFFAHSSWNVKTTWKGVTINAGGSYLDYTITLQEECDGTVGTAVYVVAKEVGGTMRRAVEYLSSCQPKGCKIFLNGELLKCTVRRGKLRSMLPWSNVYLNSSLEGERLYVRVKGVTMFNRWLFTAKSSVILELTESTVNCLTTNRDGLSINYSDELDAVIAKEFKRETSACGKVIPGMVVHFKGFGQIQHTEDSGVQAGESNDSDGTQPTGFGKEITTDGIRMCFVSDEDNFPSYGVPFVFNCRDDTSFDWNDKKVRKIGRVWYTLGSMAEKDLRKSGLIREDMKVALGFTLQDDAMAQLIRHGNYIVLLVNPKFYKRRPFTSFVVRAVNSLFHELTHLWVKDHNTKFISMMGSFPDKFGAGYAGYYEVALAMSKSCIPLGEQEIEETVDIVSEVDALMQDKGFKKVQTSQLVVWKAGNGRNVLAFLEGSKQFVFNQAVYEKLSQMTDMKVSSRKRGASIKVDDVDTTAELKSVVKQYVEGL